MDHGMGMGEFGWLGLGPIPVTVGNNRASNLPSLCAARGMSRATRVHLHTCPCYHTEQRGHLNTPAQQPQEVDRHAGACTPPSQPP